MNLHENKVLNPTEQALMDALDRLVDGAPTLIEFKQKIKDGKEIKILLSTVEKEARLSNNASRHYKDIKDLIADAEIKRKHGASTLDVAVVKVHPLYKEATGEGKKLKEEAITKPKKTTKMKLLCHDLSVHF